MSCQHEECAGGQQLSVRVDAVLGELRAALDASVGYARAARDPHTAELLTGSFMKLNAALDAFWDDHGEPGVERVLEGVEWCWAQRLTGPQNGS